MEKVYHFKTLLGHRNVEFSIACLRSFTEMSADRIELQIFEDGTITDADVQKLCSSLGNAVVIPKYERDKIVNDKLKYFPRCLLYRNSSPFAQKLFDVMLCDESDLFFIDSDVYFLRPFTLPNFSELPVFIRDDQNAYSFNPSQFLNIRFPIFPRVNTGMMFFPYRCYDLHFLEMLLADPQIQRGFDRMFWLEQTLWAFLAGKLSCNQYFDDDQIRMSRRELLIDDESVAVHLVSSFRFQFEYLSTLHFPEPNSVKRIRLMSGRKVLNKYQFAVDRIKVGLNRRMSLFQ